MLSKKLLTFGLLAGLSFLGGCYHYAPLDVTVRNADTGQPVAGATVETYYPSYPAVIDPHESTAITGRNGQATVMVATDHESKQVYLYFHSLYLNDPMPQGVVIVPLTPYRWQSQEVSHGKASPTTRPGALVVDVLTPEEYRKKYPRGAALPR